MESFPRRVIRINYVFLTRNLDVASMCTSLIEKDVLQYSSVDHLIIPYTSRLTRAAELLDLICRLGPHVWYKFLESLEDIGQGFISERLKVVFELYKQNPNISSDDVEKYFKKLGENTKFEKK